MNIIHIETSTDICSVALSDRDSIVHQVVEERGIRMHASVLPLMVKTVLEETGKNKKDINAIAYSQGPGSYTGLRVGISVAKAICYAWKLPLIAVPTLEAIAHSITNPIQDSLILPMIDAGRNEVYFAIYSPDYKNLKPASPLLLDTDFQENILDGLARIYIAGDAVQKARKILGETGKIHFGSEKVLASYMIKPAFRKFLANEYESLAYSSPEYLKAPSYKKMI